MFKTLLHGSVHLDADRFHTAYDVAHGFIEYPAVRGLTKRNSKRHSSHQRFLISSKHNTDQ